MADLHHVARILPELGLRDRGPGRDLRLRRRPGLTRPRQL